MSILWKIVHKYPRVALALGIALLIPTQTAFLILHYQTVLAIGFHAILFYGAIFSLLPLGIWYICIRGMSKALSQRNVSEREVHFNITVERKSEILAAAAAVAAGIGLLAIGICYLWSLSFKWYCIITFLYPCAKLIELLIVAPFYRRNKDDFDDFLQGK